MSALEGVEGKAGGVFKRRDEVREGGYVMGRGKGSEEVACKGLFWGWMTAGEEQKSGSKLLVCSLE